MTVVRFSVQVLDGECIPVPGVQLGVRYMYATNPSSWSSAITDADGTAWFEDDHPEPPAEVFIYVADALYDRYVVSDGSTVIIEV